MSEAGREEVRLASRGEDPGHANAEGRPTAPLRPADPRCEIAWCPRDVARTPQSRTSVALHGDFAIPVSQNVKTVVP
ncbi:hypothetical protein GCM10023335_46510 [Streptomyces siamensis]|uniref:Uncharacterized protein n=1 Tax=Streptomyces siamensis TaxID=1274986 RepID=A0ABP9J4G5_9ACTN